MFQNNWLIIYLVKILLLFSQAKIEKKRAELERTQKRLRQLNQLRFHLFKFFATLTYLPQACIPRRARRAPNRSENFV